MNSAALYLLSCSHRSKPDLNQPAHSHHHCQIHYDSSFAVQIRPDSDASTTVLVNCPFLGPLWTRLLLGVLCRPRTFSGYLCLLYG